MMLAIRLVAALIAMTVSRRYEFSKGLLDECTR